MIEIKNEAKKRNCPLLSLLAWSDSCPGRFWIVLMAQSIDENACYWLGEIAGTAATRSLIQRAMSTSPAAQVTRSRR
jgi:hypothetical protein